MAMATLCVLETLGDERRQATGPPLDAFRQALWPLLERIENGPQAGWSVARLAARPMMWLSTATKPFVVLLSASTHAVLGLLGLGGKSPGK